MTILAQANCILQFKGRFADENHYSLFSDGEPFGKAGAPGDVIGTLIDLDLNTISK